MKSIKILFIFLTAFVCGISAFAFWQYSRQPNAEQIAKAFSENSYEIFEKGEKVTLFNLQPNGRIAGKEDFHGYTILGKTEIENKSSQFLLKHSLLNGTINAYGAACFNPRHGLRIVDGEKTLDVVICFECGNFVTYYDSKIGESSIESAFAEMLYNGF